MSAWVYLALAILFEVIGTSSLKLSDGFTQILPSSVCVACFMMALYLLSHSVKTLDISVVYAIWSGVGVVLIALIGAFFFKEVMTPMRILFMALIVVGVVGLQLADSSSGHSDNLSD